jgi:hypothetical protein
MQIKILESAIQDRFNKGAFVNNKLSAFLTMFMIFASCGVMENAADNTVTPTPVSTDTAPAELTTSLMDSIIYFKKGNFGFGTPDPTKGKIEIQGGGGTAVYGNGYYGAYLNGTVYGVQAFGSVAAVYGSGGSGSTGALAYGPYGVFAFGNVYDFYAASGKPSYFSGNILAKNLFIPDSSGQNLDLAEKLKEQDALNKTLLARIESLEKIIQENKY